MIELVQKIKVQAHTGYAQLTLLKPTIPQKADEYELLLEAMCGLAARDLTSSNDEIKSDAMDFFKSKWFKWLTNLDGEMIIQKLLATGRTS